MATKRSDEDRAGSYVDGGVPFYTADKPLAKPTRPGHGAMNAPLLTEKGKAAALAGLAERRILNADRKLPDNASLPAGSPMYYRCIGCGADIVVHEGWLTKPDTCRQCDALVRLGWME